MLRVLWRLLLGGVALTLAIPFGGFVLGAGMVGDPVLRQMVASLLRAGLADGFWDLLYTLSPLLVLDTALRVAKSLLQLVTLPPILAAVIGETLGFRALTWYGGACGVLTAGLPFVARDGFRLPSEPAAPTADLHAATLLFLSGSCAGLVYWLIAGWSAGPIVHRDAPLDPTRRRVSALPPQPGSETD